MALTSFGVAVPIAFSKPDASPLLGHATDSDDRDARYGEKDEEGAHDIRPAASSIGTSPCDQGRWPIVVTCGHPP
jgi:hypothetical protein